MIQDSWERKKNVTFSFSKEKARKDFKYNRESFKEISAQNCAEIEKYSGKRKDIHSKKKNKKFSNKQ